jgi:hypothetical protein
MRPSTKLKSPHPRASEPTRGARGVGHFGLTERPPEKGEPEGGHHPGKGVKHAVPKHVHFEAGDARPRYPSRQHAVNLKELVEEDSVDEAAHSHAEKDARRDQGAAIRAGFHVNPFAWDGSEWPPRSRERR